ncbi:GNAT family N-acetyltransferase [Hymenobacter cellulosilyticus]|uniref:GNAT family N-acetyltransferase n=1 Tax=Hymenobacter cellulosilyticus TaxID=2932248 RepID=A0A8T9QBQ4_9BACT|nr:GNAT family protein [Hymenobacter cellulosilyticus]UOQ74422.1 GNAT family N-acetyltransferase [Hymenobacter cellulosilyticus]
MASDLYLREIERTDLPRINQWRNDPELIGYLGANFFFIGAGIDERWFDGYLANRDKAVRLAIVVGPDQRHIGNVQLTSIHPINRTAEFSIFIGDKDYWSAGHGRVATEQILQHGFNDLNLNRIYLTLLQENERARRMYQRLGFKEEGCQRQAIFKGGRYHDVLEMAMLREEFQQLQA